MKYDVNMNLFWMFPHRCVFLEKGLFFWGWDGVLVECINSVWLKRSRMNCFWHLKQFNTPQVWFPLNEGLKSDFYFSLSMHEPTYATFKLELSAKWGAHTHTHKTPIQFTNQQRDNLHANLDCWEKHTKT